MTHGFDLEPLLDRLLGEEAGAEHDARVRGVGAAGDRGDHDIAVVQFVIRALDLDRARLLDCRRRAAAIRCRTPPATPDSATRSCGRRGPASDGSTVAEIEFEHVGEDRVGRVGVAPQPLRLGIGLDQLDPRRVARGDRQIADRLGVDREEAAGRAVFRGHVADRRAVGERQLGDAGAAIFDKAADDAAPPQHLRHGQHEIGRGRALGAICR